MKFGKTILSLVLIASMVLCVPVTANAADSTLLTKIEVEFDDPQAGMLIPMTAKVTVSNDTVEFVYEDIELYWDKYYPETDGWDWVPPGSVFEDGCKYWFDVPDGEIERLLWDTDYELASDREVYCNGNLIRPNLIFLGTVFCIGGYESFDMVVEVVDGKPLPATGVCVFKSDTETLEIPVEIKAWAEVTETGYVVHEPGAVAEMGKAYYFALVSNEEVSAAMDMMDLRTKVMVNGVEGLFAYAVENVPAEDPTEEPTDIPTGEPSDIPEDDPTDIPADNPTDVPADEPADNPADDSDDPAATGTEDNTTVPAASSTAGDKAVKTGDDSNMVPWIALLFAAGVALTAIAVGDRKKKAAER